MFSRFHRWAANAAEEFDVPVHTAMDVMEPLPLGGRWYMFTRLREQYGDGFMDRFPQNIKDHYNTLLKVLDTNKYVSLDGSLHEEIPEGYMVDGSFVFTHDMEDDFTRKNLEYTQTEVIAETKAKIQALSSEVSYPVTTTRVESPSETVSASRVTTESQIEERRARLVKSDKSEISNVQTSVDKSSDEKIELSEDESQELPETDYAWITNNPFLNPQFPALYQKRYAKDKEMLTTIRKIVKNVSKNHIVVVSTELCIVESQDLLPSKGGRFYPEYGVWFSKKYKEFILWLFKIEDKIRFNVVDLVRERSPWMWIDVDTMSYTKKPNDPEQVCLSYLMCGTAKNIKKSLALLKSEDVGPTMPVESYDGEYTIKLKNIQKIYSVPKNKYWNLDTLSYTDASKYVDKEYFFTTSSAKLWKNRVQIRKIILNTFIQDV